MTDQNPLVTAFRNAHTAMRQDLEAYEITLSRISNVSDRDLLKLKKRFEFLWFYYFEICCR